MRLSSPLIRLIAAGALVIAAVSPGYFTFLAHPLAQSRAQFATIIDKPAPGMTDFLSSVRARTRPGDRIAIVILSTDWEPYSYVYFRAVYQLSGRRVIPVVDDRSVVHPERLREATYVAAWGARFRSDEFTTVWSGDGGSLARRR